MLQNKMVLVSVISVVLMSTVIGGGIVAWGIFGTDRVPEVPVVDNVVNKVNKIVTKEEEIVIGTIPEQWADFEHWITSARWNGIFIMGFRDMLTYGCSITPTEGCLDVDYEIGAVYIDVSGEQTNFDMKDAMNPESDFVKMSKSFEEAQNEEDPSQKLVEEERLRIFEEEVEISKNLIRKTEDGKKFVKIDSYDMPFQPSFDDVDSWGAKILPDTQNVYYLGMNKKGDGVTSYHVRTAHEEVDQFDVVSNLERGVDINLVRMLVSPDTQKFGYIASGHISDMSNLMKSQEDPICELNVISPVNQRPYEIDESNLCFAYGVSVFFDGKHGDNYSFVELDNVQISIDGSHILYEAMNAGNERVGVVDHEELKTNGSLLSVPEFTEDQKSINYLVKRGMEIIKVTRPLE